MKNHIIIILISFSLLLTLSIDYGWRLFAFNGCSSPNIPSINEVTVTDGVASLSGTTYNSAPHFVGYISQVKDKTLYVGIRYQLITIFHSGGDFNITIPLENVDIERIYIKGKNSSELIWEKDNKKVN